VTPVTKTWRLNNQIVKLDGEAITHALPMVAAIKNLLLKEYSRQKFSRTVLRVISAVMAGPAFITAKIASFHTFQPSFFTGIINGVSTYAYSPRVWRRATSTLAMGRVPITRSISVSAIVARLSVITTESVNKPDC
jgi:hypothetical protein